jgi:ribose-phosphate pyrophosphokinase
MLENAVVFALTANNEMANEIVGHLGLKLGNCVVRHFADGEIMINTLDSVRGKKVYIIQSTANPVTERLMELLIFIDALKRASAKEITAVVPYYGYARQDRKASPREPITAKLVANLLQTAGINRIVTIDLHAPQIQGFFDVPVDELSAIPFFAKYLIQNILKNDDFVVVAPDHGGTTRARRLSLLLNCPIAIVDKRRPRPNVAEVLGIVGDVNGKIAIMLDDIIDTGGTIIEGAKKIMENGAKKVYVVCTHGIFSGDAIDNLDKSVIEQVIISNTIALPNRKIPKKIKVISLAPMIAKAIEHIEQGLSLSVVYDLFNKP